MTEKNKKMPKIIKDVGFDFRWSEEKVWKLDIPVEEMPISDLEWHFDIPFWFKEGGYYDLKPREVIENREKWQKEFDRTMNASLEYPLDIMFWKNRWLLLDGLHRLVKAKILGNDKIRVRKIPQSAISLITK